MGSYENRNPQWDIEKRVQLFKAVNLIDLYVLVLLKYWASNRKG